MKTNIRIMINPMITVLMIKIKIIATIATTIIMIIYIVITILIFLILTAIFILTIILPLFYDNNNYNDECNNNKGNSNSVKNNSNSKNNNDKCRHKKRKNNTNLNNDNDNRRDNNNNNSNERSVFILGGNTVKSLNGIFTTKTNNHKCILKVRPFSSTKVQYMYDQVKLSIRDVNLANIILHVGTYDLKSKKTSSQITKPIIDLTDILNNTAKRRFK